MEVNYKEKYLKYKLKYQELQESLNNQNIEQSGGGMKQDSDKMDIMLFKAEWCGHCKQFKSTWGKLKDQFNNKFNFITYDSVKDARKIKEHKINGYPTIMFKDNVLTKSYEGPRDYESLEMILSNMTMS